MSAALLISALLAAFLGSASLALSQRKHWQVVTSSSSTPGQAPRRAGWSLLGASFLLTILRDGASFGALFWPMLLGLSVMVTALLMTWAPQALRPLARSFVLKN